MSVELNGDLNLSFRDQKAINIDHLNLTLPHE
jgi:hypothetical protein